jgi:hypothetical protein
MLSVILEAHPLPPNTLQKELADFFVQVPHLYVQVKLTTQKLNNAAMKQYSAPQAKLV